MKHSVVLFLACFIYVNYSFSQKKNQYKCPQKVTNAIKSGYFFEDPGKAFIMVGAGYLFSYPYANPQKETDKYYSVSTKPKLYVTAFYHKPLTMRAEFFAGVQIMQNQQGASFKYQSGGSKVKESAYAVSQLFRIPIGFSYKITPSFKMGAGVAFIYSAHLFNMYSGGIGGGASSNLRSYQYNWVDSFEDDKYYLGMDIFANKKIYKRIGLTLQLSIDLRESVATGGNSSLEFNNGNIETFSVYTKPYLMYGAIGISYRFF